MMNGTNYFNGLGEMFEGLMKVSVENAEAAKQNVLSIVSITKNLEQVSGILSTTIPALQEDVLSVTQQVGQMSQDIIDLKENEEITTAQSENIQRAAKRRVYEVLGSGCDDYSRYYRVFIKRLYTEAKQRAGLGSSISRTRKGDYKVVMNFIEVWIPACGVSELKEYVDRMAASKKKAITEGYTL